MASKPPSDCCNKGFKHEGTPQGSMTQIAGVDAYVTGDKSAKNVLLFIPDVLGPEFINAQILADNFAQEGFLVVSPDIYFGDAVPHNKQVNFQEWVDRHPVEKTEPIVDKVFDAIKTQFKPDFIASVGYCFGARYVVRLLDGNKINAGALAHPSFVTMEEVRAIKGPVIISAAEEDTIFSAEFRSETETALKEIKAQYFIEVFSGTAHGFAVRGDPNDFNQRIAKEKTFCDQVWWFKLFQKGRS